MPEPGPEPASLHDALALLRRCVSRRGLVAAASAGADAPRIATRDGCVVGLAALLHGDAELIDAFETTLESLSEHFGPSGQAPSHVADDEVCYGGKAGGVDATLWFIVGVCQLGRLAGRDEVVDRHFTQLLRAVDLLRAWEFNDRGLLYVPLGGDWADEYVLQGYVLYDQVLRVWAMRELYAAAGRIWHPGKSALKDELRRIQSAIGKAFLPSAHRGWFLAGYHPGRQFSMFDAFGNALACLMDLGAPRHRRTALDEAAARLNRDLVPAFDPVIRPGDPHWHDLRGAAAGELRNSPGCYQNGGLWPMLSGFWALAARHLGEGALAERLARGIGAANALGDAGFSEYLNAQTGAPEGTPELAWSAAAQLLATADPARLLPR